MTPDMPSSPFRFRAGHEFMHVIQSAYAYSFSGGPLAEGFANWAAAWAMPDINPLDSNFFGDQQAGSPHPWTPLDCGTDQCGSGYWQRMFIQDEVQAYGPGFVSGYHERYAATAAPPHVWDGAYWLDLEIKAVTGGSQNLSTRFGAYAGDVWDPTRSAKDSLRILRDQYGRQPPAYTYQLSSHDRLRNPKPDDRPPRCAVCAATERDTCLLRSGLPDRDLLATPGRHALAGDATREVFRP